MEVKERLLNQIEKINNEALLEQIEMFISKLLGSDEMLYPLDEAMSASIERGDADIKEGRVIEHHEFMKSTREWIHER